MGRQELGGALFEQMARLAYVNGTAFTNVPAEELAAELATMSPSGMDKAYFLSSGSEAVEAALKLARQYWVEMGAPAKHKIIAQPRAITAAPCWPSRASARERCRNSTVHGWSRSQ